MRGLFGWYPRRRCPECGPGRCKLVYTCVVEGAQNVGNDTSGWCDRPDGLRVPPVTGPYGVRDSPCELDPGPTDLVVPSLLLCRGLVVGEGLRSVESPSTPVLPVWTRSVDPPRPV